MKSIPTAIQHKFPVDSSKGPISHAGSAQCEARVADISCQQIAVYFRDCCVTVES